jgi:hypothetical protein
MDKVKKSPPQRFLNLLAREHRPNRLSALEADCRWGALSVRNSASRMASRTFSRKFIAVERKDMGIHHAHADQEDGDLPDADCDPQGARMHREMRRFFIALGTKVMIDLFSTHDMASSCVKRVSPPIQRKYKPFRGIPPVSLSLILSYQAYQHALRTKPTRRYPPPSAS